MIIILIFLCPMAAVVLYLFLTAPDGWEDESGFHYGKKE